MTGPHVAGGEDRRAQLTRARILEAARQELGRDPDSSLDHIAGAAGVVRRTVYGHFAGRSAVIEGLVADATQALRRALTPVKVPDPDAIAAMARFVLALWPVGDRYRTLLRLSPQDLGTERVNELLAPARDMATAIIARGQRQGVFHSNVPPGPLSRAVEGHLLALLECVNAGTWRDDGTRSATAALIAVGADGDLAVAQVRQLVRTGPVSTGKPRSKPAHRLVRTTVDHFPGGRPCTGPSTATNP
ncbi:TetR/AcrR family transcriptional regulator [Streptomyces sp. NPDC005374]|uniref:TetR/AcrR family transcriptional regulator n=1 Tax=Streptomyces sp. NPDC005374 TaxID=3364713 RepID=UPI0036B60F53